MRRMIIPIRKTGFVAAAIAFALLALLPLRQMLDLFAFDRLGLSARSATGSVWRGALHDAKVGSIVLGDVETRLNLLPLLIGEARLTLDSSSRDGDFEVAVTRTRNSFGFEGLSGRFLLGGTALSLPISTMETDGLSGRFSRGRCIAASGRMIVSAAGLAPMLGIPAAFQGTARCEGEAMLIGLAGASAAERLEIRLFADGRYRLDLMVRQPDPAIGLRLTAAGFTRGPSGYAMTVSGEF